MDGWFTSGNLIVFRPESDDVRDGYRRLSLSTPRKRLESMVWKPSAIAVTDGITTRKVSDGLRPPKPLISQLTTAKIDPAIPSNKARPPQINPFSRLTSDKCFSSLGSSGSRPSLIANTFVNTAKITD